MTNLSTILQRLQTAEQAEQAKTTSKAKQAEQAEQAQAEQADANDTSDMIHGKTVIIDFFADLQGSERLARKYLKKWNSFGNGSTVLQATDWDEAKSRVYLAVLETPITPDDVELWETTKQYFGITTLQQYRKGYNAFQKMMRENANRSTKVEYNQDYGLTGTNANKATTEEAQESREIQEAELEIILTAIFTKELKIQLELKLQGYTLDEMATMTGTSRRTVANRNTEIKKILATAYEIK